MVFFTRTAMHCGDECMDSVKRNDKSILYKN